jgi:hypothetical protein
MFLKACGLMVLPIAAALPALSLAKFGPCGPSTGWSLIALTLVSVYCEFRAFNLFRKGFSGEKDFLWLMRFPLGLFSICILILNIIVFVLLALPALLFGDLRNIFA